MVKKYCRELSERVDCRHMMSSTAVDGWAAAGRKVFVTRRVPGEGVEMLKSAGCVVTQWDSDSLIPRDELVRGVRGCDALFCLLTDRIDKHVLDAAGPQMRVIGTMSVGYEHLDLHECRARNIVVGYTPDVLTDATAELTVALLLATSRRLMPAMKAVRSGEWSTWRPLWMCGRGLASATVGIVGLGRIGFAVAQRLRPFAVSRILYTGHREKPYAAQVAAEFVPLDVLLAQSDFVIASCPMSPETNNLFSASTFSRMKRTSIFVNTSRGGVVNQADLCEALKTGVIAAAGLDVTTPEPLPVSDELLTLDNCVVLPHIGSATVETRTAMSVLTAKNILSALSGKPLPCPLDV